jgi:RNA polymerase sigma-70 factor, ECF subfamily
MTWDAVPPEAAEAETDMAAGRPAGLHAAPTVDRDGGAGRPIEPAENGAGVQEPVILAELPAGVESLPRIDTDQLGVLFAKGEPFALAEAYRRFSPLVYTLSLRTLGRVSDAEDVTQRVFIQAWRGTARYDPDRRPLVAWLVGITRHLVSDRMAQRSRDGDLQQRAELRDRLPGSDDDAIAERVADAVVVADGLAHIGQPRRRVIELSFFEGLTHTQISDALGLPLGTVTSHIKRGLAQLKTQLEVSDEPS